MVLHFTNESNRLVRSARRRQQPSFRMSCASSPAASDASRMGLCRKKTAPRFSNETLSLRSFNFRDFSFNRRESITYKSTTPSHAEHLHYKPTEARRERDREGLFCIANPVARGSRHTCCRNCIRLYSTRSRSPSCGRNSLLSSSSYQPWLSSERSPGWSCTPWKWGRRAPPPPGTEYRRGAHRARSRHARRDVTVGHTFRLPLSASPPSDTRAPTSAPSLARPSPKQFEQQLEDTLALLETSLLRHVSALVDVAESTAHFTSAQMRPGGRFVVSGLQARVGKPHFPPPASRPPPAARPPAAAPSALAAAERHCRFLPSAPFSAHPQTVGEHLLSASRASMINFCVPVPEDDVEARSARHWLPRAPASAAGARPIHRAAARPPHERAQPRPRPRRASRRGPTPRPTPPSPSLTQTPPSPAPPPSPGCAIAPSGGVSLPLPAPTPRHATRLAPRGLLVFSLPHQPPDPLPRGSEGRPRRLLRRRRPLGPTGAPPRARGARRAARGRQGVHALHRRLPAHRLRAQVSRALPAGDRPRSRPPGSRTPDRRADPLRPPRIPPSSPQPDD